MILACLAFTVDTRAATKLIPVVLINLPAEIPIKLEKKVEQLDISEGRNTIDWSKVRHALPFVAFLAA